MLNNNLLHSSAHFNLYVYCNKSSLVSKRLIISLAVRFRINIIPAGPWYNCLYISLHSLHWCKYCTCYSYPSSINQKVSNWTVMLSVRCVWVCVLTMRNICKLFPGGIYWSSWWVFRDHVAHGRNQLHSCVIKLYSDSWHKHKVQGKWNNKVCCWWKQMTDGQIWGRKVESGAKSWGHESGSSSSSLDKDKVLTEKDGTKRSSIYLC